MENEFYQEVEITRVFLNVYLYNEKKFNNETQGMLFNTKSIH